MTEPAVRARQPSIALVTGSLSPLAGGIYFSARLPANCMAEKGRSPAVLGLADERWPSARITWCVDYIRAVPRRGPAGYLSTGPMLANIAAIAPDLVHLRGIWGPHSLAAWRWHQRTGRPLLISTHGMVDWSALRISRRKKKILGALYELRNLQGATALHALNPAEERSMRALGCRNPVAIIPNGVDIRPLGRARQPSGRPPNLLYLSRLHPKKGVVELVRAWAHARRLDSALRSWTLTLAGWGSPGYVAQLQQLVASLELQSSVRFVGPLFDTDKLRAFESADAFVLPSHSEGLPIAVLEAWERGLPVLMTDACNLPEGFTADAALRTTTDPAVLARDIVTLCTLPADERTRMGAKGRALVADRFGWRQISEQFLALYDWMAGCGERPNFVT